MQRIPRIVLGWIACAWLASAAWAQTVTVVIAPATVRLAPGQSVQMQARVVGAPPQTPVRWSLRGPRYPGVDWGRLTNTGLYTAPLRPPTGQVFIVATVFGQFGQPVASASAPVNLAVAAPPGQFRPPVAAPPPRPPPSVPPGVLRALPPQIAPPPPPVAAPPPPQIAPPPPPVAAPPPPQIVPPPQIAPPPPPPIAAPPPPQIPPPPPTQPVIGGPKQVLFSRLYDLPDDLAWHENTLWGANLVQKDSVTKVNVHAALQNLASGQKPPFNIRAYVQKTYTAIRRVSGEEIPLRGPTGLTSDGTHLWLATYHDKRIWQLSPGPSHLIEVRSFNYQPGGGPRGLAWANGRPWVADDVHGRIYQLDPQSGRVLSWFASPSTTGQPTGLAFDGRNLRLATYHDGKYWTLSLTGAVVSSEPSFGPGPVGLVWAQGSLWGDDDKWDQLHK